MFEILLIIIGVLIALIVVGSLLAKLPGVCHREERLMQIVAELDLAYEPGPRSVPEHPYHNFAAFQVAGDLSLLCTMRGTLSLRIGDHDSPCEVHMGDFEQEYEEYDPSPWNSSNTKTVLHRSSYLLLRLPFDELPSTRIRHRLGPGGTGVLPGREAIRFEWDQFNRDLQVTCSDRRFAFDVISKRMMEFLHAHPGYPLAIENGWLCLTDGHSQWSPKEFRESIEWLRAFLSLWPRYLAPSDVA